MPSITGLSTSQIRDANTAFAMTFFPRALKSKYQSVCGVTKSSAMVEPFALAGSAPLLSKFSGSLNFKGTKSWSMYVPNHLFKAAEKVQRKEIEFDQTRTVRSRMAQLGIRVAQLPDYLLAKRFMKGAVAGSSTQVGPDGVSYTITFDGKLVYAADHDQSGASQSNIVQGHLPNTAVGVTGQDIAITAQQFVTDIETITDTICGWKDDRNAAIFPDFNPAEHLKVIVPPILDAGARLGLLGGSIAGTGGSAGSSGTTDVRKLVKEVVTMGLLKGCPDVEADDPETASAIAPVNPTDYYFTIEDDFLKPWYYQRFMPKKSGETVPVGEDPESQARKALAAANSGGFAGKIKPEMADTYANTEIAHNFGALGSNAQESVVMKEEFFLAARTYLNIFPGPWFLNGRVKPVSGS